MAPGGGSMRGRKRPERSFSHDNSGDQPPAKSPRGNRYPSNTQANSRPQTQYRDGGQRGGYANHRGSRGTNSSAHPPRKSTPLTPATSITSAPAPVVEPVSVQPSAPSPIPVVEKSQDTPMSNTPQATPAVPIERHYDMLTNEIVQDWEGTGKTTIVQNARDAKQVGDHIRLGCLFQEITYSGLDGRIDAKDAGDTIKLIIHDVIPESDESTLDTDTAEAYLDTVAVACLSDVGNTKLRQIILSTDIPYETVVLNLEAEMLEAQKLVRSSWTRMGIRYQTNALYRQANYNLLREETEGYSKLLTELFTTVDSDEPTHEVVKQSFERVKAMIGAFNLDVGRVLDVILDVFASVLVRHTSFLVQFLSISTWWPREITSGARHESEIALNSLPSWTFPEDAMRDSVSADLRRNRDEIFWSRVKEVGLKAFFELGGRRADPKDLDSVLPAIPDDVEVFKNPDGSVKDTKVTIPRSNILRQWIEETGTLPPQGNQDAAQILGFKLRFYHSAARDVDDNLPSNLIYLAALLIKIGFISFLDLYPHIWPADDAMKDIEARLRKEKEEKEKERKPGGRNALELAGALVDDTVPVPSRRLPEPTARSGTKVANKPESTAAPDKTKEEANKLPDPIDQKIQLLKSLLLIGAIPEALFMLGQFPWLMELVAELPEHINRILHQCLSQICTEIPLFEDHDGVSEPSKFADPDQPAPQKGYVQLARNNPRKVLRWAQIDKADGNDGVDYKFYWEDWIDNIPLCHNVDDVFSLCNTLVNISGFKIGKDPSLMAKLSRIGRHSLDNDSSEENKTRWTYLCKRLLVPALSLSDGNPGTVAEVWGLLRRFPTNVRYNIYFEWNLGQISRHKDIQSAFNYSSAEIKDVLKKISKTNTRPMARQLAKVAVGSPGKVFEVVIKQIESYDNLIGVVVEGSRYFSALGYDILTWSLINALGKARGRVQDDGMLTSKWLSKLATFCGSVFKRYPVMNPIPVLQYVTNQLLNSNSTDLVVLLNLVESMAGITQDATFNDNQIIAMCGGPVLRSNAMTALQDKRQEPGMKLSTKRLMNALATSSLTGPLLVAICQERQSCVFDVEDAEAHLKLLANFFDEIHRVLTQYLDLLQSNLADQEFKALIPTLTEMIGEYGIEPSVAFWIWRPTIASDIAAYDKGVAEKQAAASKIATLDAAKDVEMVDAENAGERQSNGVSSAVEDNTDETSEAVESTEIRPGHPVVHEIMDAVRPVLPQTTFEMISDSFYFTFWRLSPYDLHIPETYHEESRRLTAKIEQIKNERSGSSSDIRNRETQRKILTEQNTKVAAELKEHLTAYQRTKVSLTKEKDIWFDLSAGSWDDLNIAILEHCFIPRMVLSSVDSFFVFKMLKVLHSMGAKNFRTMGLLDCFFNGKRLLPLFFSCTAKEAENIGRFINEVLKDLNKWHASKDLYEKEAFGAKKDLPGFKKNLSLPDSFLDHESFRTLYSKWHRNLHDALRDSLKSPEYMHIRNAIIILKSMVTVFPMIDWMGKNLEEAMKHVQKVEERQDIKLSAQALIGFLGRRSKEWVTAPVFARHKPGQANGPQGSKASPSQAKSPVDNQTDTKSLNAKAPDFVPGALSIDPTKKRDARGEAEDGEIRTPTTAKLPPTNTSINRTTTNTTTNTTPTSRMDDRSSLKPLPSRLNDRNHDRNSSNASPRLTPDSRHQDLPSRPDLKARQPSHSRPNDLPRNHNQPPRLENNNPPRAHDSRGAPRDGTDPRELDYRRGERGPEPDRRDSGRSYDRPYNDREAQEVHWGGERQMSRPQGDRTPPTHSRPPLRDEKSDRPPLPVDPRDRYRETEIHDSRARDVPRATRGAAAPIHSDRNSLLKTAQEHDRSQHGGYPERRHEAVRPVGEANTSVRGSRGSSPARRPDEGSLRSEYKRYDERAPDDRRSTDQTPPRPRHDESRGAHAPRSEYPGDLTSKQFSDRQRDEPRGPHPSSTWLQQDGRASSRQQDSSYGRLNQDAPAGPRTVSANSVAVAPRPPRQAVSQQKQSSAATSGTNGSGTDRSSQRNASSHGRPQISTNIPPQSSTSSSPDTAGIHPDRLKALQSLEQSADNKASRSPISQPPSGPRASTLENSGPPKAAHNDSKAQEGGRGRRMFNSLNNTLSQADGPGGSEKPSNLPPRGRGGPSNEGHSSVNTTPSNKGPPTPVDSGSRQDQSSNRHSTQSSRGDHHTNHRGSRTDDRRTADSPSEGPRPRQPYNSQRDMRAPSNGDMREGRGRGGPPLPPQTPPTHNHTDRRATRGDQQGSGPGDRNGRRDSGRDQWNDAQQRTDYGRGQAQNDGSGRKRSRGSEEVYDQAGGQMPYDYSKRPRRG